MLLYLGIYSKIFGLSFPEFLTAWPLTGFLSASVSWSASWHDGHKTPIPSTHWESLLSLDYPNCHARLQLVVVTPWTIKGLFLTLTLCKAIMSGTFCLVSSVLPKVAKFCIDLFLLGCLCSSVNLRSGLPVFVHLSEVILHICILHLPVCLPACVCVSS